MTRVCKPHSLLAVYLLIQGLSYVFFVIFIHFNLEAVNTFVMKIIKLHKLHVKPLKSCYRAIHHLLILITKALQHLLLLDNTRKREKQGKRKERQHRMKLGKWTKAKETLWWCWRTMKKETRDRHDSDETQFNNRLPL